jgi:hypothetical protein
MFDGYEPRPDLFQNRVFLHAHGPNFSSIGWIKEIGLDGVVYEYCMADGANDSDTVQVDIFRRDLDVYISGIPCKIIYDVLLDIPYFSNVMTKQCGLQFRELTEFQRGKLMEFLSVCPSQRENQTIFGYDGRLGDVSR